MELMNSQKYNNEKIILCQYEYDQFNQYKLVEASLVKYLKCYLEGECFPIFFEKMNKKRFEGHLETLFDYFGDIQEYL